MSVKNNIKVCFSTGQFEKYTDGVSTVVIVDLLRATSVISTAFECGVDAVIPVTNSSEALLYKNVDNHIIAAERNTLRLDGFDYGNSPYHYINSDVKGKTLVLTTTNGTKAIHLAKGHKVITASFVNIDAVVTYLLQENNDVIVLCAGWKGFFNLEDPIFAGALCEKLLNTNHFVSNCDALYASIQLYSSAKDNLFEYLEVSSYRKRNMSHNVMKDTHFCLNPTILSAIVPVFVNGKLIAG
ncbi:MAG: 2-phosphosulfolactate phosphatase [Bacteroidota bacterium]|nr:2-phosphosulfolactate phosphatase [Bacteroidota bacterium]